MTGNAMLPGVTSSLSHTNFPDFTSQGTTCSSVCLAVKRARRFRARGVAEKRLHAVVFPQHRQYRGRSVSIS